MPKQKILLAVTGSIAAYKSIEILRLLVKNQHEVMVVLTQSALRFVQPLTFQALGAKEVRTDLMDAEAEASMSHIEMARWADILLIAPATANSIAKFANGLADDLLSTIYLATQAKIIISPAMNTVMWQHNTVQKNIATLVKNQATIIEPDSGELACGEVGTGKLASVATLVAQISASSDDPLVSEAQADFNVNIIVSKIYP